MSDGYKQMMPDDIIVKILSNIECQIYEPGQLIVQPEVEMQNLYLIKRGQAVCFDRNYEYVCHLEEGSFFGEFNILFGLYSNLFYQAHLEQGGSNMIVFLIDK